MKLSETEPGKRWVNQFKKPDRMTAKVLLDDLIYISNDELISGLYNLVSKYLKKHKEQKIALFAARENMGNTYWRNRYTPPKNIHRTREVGSEGIIANLCRDIAKKNDSVLNHPSIEEMKKHKCQFMFFLDDMIASGTRMIKFSRWLYSNEIIKSWHSYGYVKFVSCSYGASTVGEVSITNDNLIYDIIKCQSNTSGRSIWNDEKNKKIKKLCYEYSKYTSKSFFPLGYKSAFTTMYFDHSCPNTNPSILWASKKNSWEGIFDKRPELVFKKDISHKNIERVQIEALKSLGQTNLNNPSNFKKLSPKSKQLIVLLSCVARRKNKVNILSDMMELEVTVIRQLIEICIENKWLDPSKRITKSGKQLLIAARKNKYIQDYNLSIKTEFYHPRNYRGSTSSSSVGLSKGDSHE
ncbi:MAG: phosphoribosyltransferase-like protein [Bacteroidota bacterium]